MRSTAKKWLVALTSAIVSFTAIIVIGPRMSSAAPPDGHQCWWWFPTSVPNFVDYPSYHINYTQGVYCDGLVNSIYITTEVLFHGPFSGAPGTTVNGNSHPFPNVTSAALGVATPGSSCTSGYYSGRATATIHYRSGQPEYITGEITSGVVWRDCTPGHVPTPTVTVIPPAPHVRAATNSIINKFGN